MLRLAGQITRENNPELFSVMDQLDLLIVIFSAAGELLYGNQPALSALGGAVGDLVWRLPVWEDHAEQVQRQFGELVETLRFTESYRFDLSLPRRPRDRVFRFELTPFFDAGGALESVIAQGNDITDYLMVEDQLRKQERLLSVTVESAPVVLFVIDRSGVVRFSAGRARQLLTERGRNVVGRHLANTYGDLPEVFQYFQRALSGDTFSVRLPLMDLVFDVSYAPLREENGEITGVVGVGTDVTQQVQAEAELLEMQHRLIQASEGERLRLAQDLHDGPLQEVIAVTYQLQALAALAPGLTEQAAFDEVRAALQGAIRDVRTLCGELRPPALAPFGLEKAIRSYAEQYQKKHPETLILLNLDADRQSLPELTRLTLFRIFQEAMNNIARHSEATLARVRLSLSETEVVLEVKDNGKGFQPPKRWVLATREGHLGLVGAMERAQALGGVLELQAEEETGVMLRVTIPRPKVGLGASSEE